MTEHKLIKFTRTYCRQRGIRYQIRGVNDALFLFDTCYQKYRQVCFSLLNLTEAAIAAMIAQECRINRKVVYTIDDRCYMINELKRENPSLSTKAIADIVDDVKPFRVTFTLYGNGRTTKRYELVNSDTNTVMNINDLNGYERGVIINDCYTHFEGRDREGYFSKTSETPCGVIKITEEVVS